MNEFQSEDAKRPKRPVCAGAVLLLLGFSAIALGVSTSHWTQNCEADFKAGTLHNVVATNFGDLKLSRAVKTLLEEDPRVSMVTSLVAAPDGTIYAGTAPRGVVLKISGDKVSTVATIDDTVSISALEVEPDGSLLVGASGGKGRILRIGKAGSKPYELFSQKGVQYVWAIKELPDRTIYAATGPNGQLFAIHPYGATEEIYKSDENNLTALVSDGKDLLYVGTDPDGMVVRVNRQTKESFVMYNADEEEITALALDGQGNLYAATGTELPSEQTPAAAEPATPGPSGRPESGTQVPLPSQQPTPPAPPKPTPNPGQPPPIPQTQQSMAPIDPVLYLSTSDDDDDQPGDNPAQPTPPGLPAPAAATPDNSNQPAAAAPAEPSKGNAVYKIDREGFVTEIFRAQVVIYCMIAKGDLLFVGTGDDGEIYQIDPIRQETVVVAKTDAKEVTALAESPDGRIILGLSNTGGLSAMTDGYTTSGTFISPVMDAMQISRFGVIQMHGSLPAGTSLTVATRAGNVKDADAQGWTKWTPEAKALEFLPIASPPARFLQYRITFSTTDETQTPIIKDVDVAYQLPHLAPVVKSIKIADAQPAGGAAQPPPPPPGAKPADAAKPGGTGIQTITWDTDDLDNDTLSYSLYFRLAPAGEWILLKDKLADATFNWDTRTVADGRYEVKVVASDALANPIGDGKIGSRISDVLVVDNTPPAIGDIKMTVNGKSVKIDLRVTAAASTVASMEYSLDSNEDWQTVLPVDTIFDKPEELVSFSLDGLTAGAHQITLRATDGRGNVAYQTVTVTVGN
jgi:hypothetical protein